MSIPQARETRRSFVPEMAKEVIFWCAVFVVAVTGTILISQMGPTWSIPVSPAMSASTPVSVDANPVQTPVAMTVVQALVAPPAPESYMPDPAEQPPTF